MDDFVCTSVTTLVQDGSMTLLRGFIKQAEYTDVINIRVLPSGVRGMLAVCGERLVKLEELKP